MAILNNIEGSDKIVILKVWEILEVKHVNYLRIDETVTVTVTIYNLRSCA